MYKEGLALRVNLNSILFKAYTLYCYKLMIYDINQ